MFKRANKITALLVAAASIMSVVPAMAASTQRLETKDGTIEKAVMFKDGKYIYQGYRNDGDTTSIYYNDGTKDKEIENLSEGTLGSEADESNTKSVAKYDTSSVAARDDDNENYLVDLATGKASDEDTIEDLDSTAKDNLRSKLKKTDRYEKDATVEVTQLKSNEFAETWYQYKATSTGSADNYLYGYAKKDGKTYIDASVTANVRVFNGEKMVKIEKFDDKDDDLGIVASIDKDFVPVTIAQDKDNFYRVIKVNFTGTTKVYDSVGKGIIADQYYLQKISKAQSSDKEDDAYLPKSVDSYLITKDLDDDDDLSDAYYQLFNAVGISTDESKEDDKVQVGVSAVDGALYVTQMKKNNKVTVFKFELAKNEKYTADKKAGGTTNVDVYLVKADTDVSCDVSGIDDGTSAVSIDVNGNTWAINEGKIYKSTKAGDFKEMYTCDRSLDTLQVYDDTSLMAWSSEGDVYTTVKEGTAAAKSTDDKDKKPAQPVVTPVAPVVTPVAPVVTPVAPVVTPVAPVVTVKAGWNKAANGTWTYLDATGAKTVNKWIPDGAKWYYLGADGVMKTSAWVQDGATWYYVGTDGAMLTNQYVGSYWVNGSGAWVK